MTAFSFKAKEVDANSISDAPQEFKPLPDGWYHVVAIDSDIRTTNRGDGRYISYKFEVIENGEFQGRYLWDRFNIENPNAMAVEIATKNLARFAQSAGVDEMENTFDLHHRPVQVLLRQRTWEGKVSNEVKGYKQAEMKTDEPKSDLPF